MDLELGRWFFLNLAKKYKNTLDKQIPFRGSLTEDQLVHLLSQVKHLQDLANQYELKQCNETAGFLRGAFWMANLSPS